MSYYGWFKYANTFNLWQKYIDDKVHFVVKQVFDEANIQNPLKNKLFEKGR